MMRLQVTTIEALTPSVRLIRLADPRGAMLPAFDAGSHIELSFRVEGETVSRKYTLVSLPNDRRHYDIAVKRNDRGRGGSAFLHHRLSVGDELEVCDPVNEFGVARDGRHHVLIAGGIGITPMLGILSQLEASNASFELHYAARTESEMAFRDRFSMHDRSKVALYFTQAGPSERMDVDRLLAVHREQTDTHVYVCGPARLIDGVRLAAEAFGIRKQRIHFESFGPAWEPTDGSVRLAMTESGIELDVAPGTPLLDAMEAAGAWIPSDCRRGECGACIAGYTGGKPIHRDNCLTVEQRAHSFCPCVSWAASGEVLSLQL